LVVSVAFGPEVRKHIIGGVHEGTKAAHILTKTQKKRKRKGLESHNALQGNPPIPRRPPLSSSFYHFH
jgi:hypothetical protein